ncbi:MAG: putative esterase [Solirubrobacteraceae bacterium]|nr:putative esterase [Solirubrobacteraceae bacterium]
MLAVVLVALAGYGLVRAAEYWWPFGQVQTGRAAAHGARIQRYTIRSGYVHRTLAQTAATPPGGGSGRPLLVLLHGKETNGQGNETFANGDFFGALARLGRQAPDVVFPNGGNDSYWHARGSGDWGAYVLREVIPEAVRRLHADGRRVAIGGVSMGGFGAFDIARRAPGRFCAVGGHSAAMWLRGGDTAPGAFDDGTDFARNDIVALAQRRGRAAWGRARLWLDGGTRDPFRASDEALARALGITMRHWPGGHDRAYWHARYVSYLRFYADALAACR